MGHDGLLIGEVAARSGLSRKAIRLYVARGIVPRAGRTPAGYRRYPADVLAVLSFVQQAQKLGLTLTEIAHIVTIRRSGTPPCAYVREVLERKATELDAVLVEVRGTLADWDRRYRGRLAAVCPHIEAKGGDTSWNSARSRSARSARPARRSSSPAMRSASARPTTPPSSRRTNGTSSST